MKIFNIILLSFLLNSLICFANETKNTNGQIYLFSSLGNRSIVSSDTEKSRKFNQSGIAVNFHVDSGELYLQLGFRDFHESKLSSEGNRFYYLSHYNNKFSWGFEYESLRSNMLYISQTENPGEIRETRFDGFLLQAIASYNILSKKNYRVSIFGGFGRHTIAEMSGSYTINGKKPVKDKVKKNGGIVYTINPRIEFRTDSDYRLKFDYIFRKSHTYTDSLRNQNQLESNLMISIGSSF